MAAGRRTVTSADPDFFDGKARRAVPHEFVLDSLTPVAPWTRSMFGCLAVYVGERIVLILRDKHKPREDDGVWLATTAEHHASLRTEFPGMRSIRLFATMGMKGDGVTGWQVLPADAPDFESAALKACALIRAGDPRIGKIPVRRRSRPLRVGTTRKGSGTAR